jgi:quercetin dioxygenase-like cupin family protein
MNALRIGTVVAVVVASTSGALAADNALTLGTLLESGTAVTGEQVVYPKGTPQITANILAVPPGYEGSWHTALVPSYHYVLEGEVTVDFGDHGGAHVFKAGDSFLEVEGVPHKDSNTSTETARTFHVYFGVEGTDIVSSAGETSSQSSGETLTTLFIGNQTILGQQIVYPEGTAYIFAEMLTVQPGASDEGWRTDLVPSLHYILQGANTVDYGSNGIRVLNTGDSLLEAVDIPHSVSNSGTIASLAIGVFLGVKGGTLSQAAAGPQ